MSKIDLSKLRPVALADRRLFDEKLGILASQSCECCFPNIFMYQQPYGIEFVEIEGRLVVFERESRTIHYPIGEWTGPELLNEISCAFRAAGLTDGGIYDVPEDFLDRHEDCDQFFELEFDEGAIDYLYSVDKIATFAGPKLRKKHNLVKQFQTNWPYAEVRRIDKNEIAAASHLAIELNSRLEPCEFLDEEALALERAWSNFEELGLGGVILYAEPGFPVGFSVYSVLPSNTVDVHFEKADHTVKGAPQTLTWQLAIALRGKARFMNREQDMNEETLRHAKRSLDPERFFKRYFLRSL
ncbi:MAG: phosphatidylglycerol lysyltransferase domain-containing protein [Victivallaceae bacterium]|nr:phosphatidylglycerol lysyltransferase domain-containing protein [Victivallaceae bacterium]